jgi:hypothetical protein
MADEVRIYRDVFLSIHEDLEFLTRVRTVSRHITSVFTRDKKYMNEL